MKTFYTFFLVIISLFILNSSFAQTNIFPSTGAAGIGTTTPNPSSLLDIVSTSKGMLIPRMNKAQRDVIATPSTGLLIYQTNSTPGFYYYNGSAWAAISVKEQILLYLILLHQLQLMLICLQEQITQLTLALRQKTGKTFTHQAPFISMEASSLTMQEAEMFSWAPH